MDTTPNDLDTLYSDRHLQCVITSYGAGHHDDPHGSALLVDTRILRNPPEDPEVRERMLHSTGLDPEVRRYVMATEGARELVAENAEKVRILLQTGNLQQWANGQLFRVDVHVVCGGGRHRSVAVAAEIAAYLRAAGIGCEVEHRHIDRPILETGPANA
ncbi:RNase adapter RapZ [Streptomyces beijiangensis]|uniref:RapZ C-terminal domain-containing protein n=1 Tax=Streptomyces beijiangensis TaxID=163361 RepID=UPI0031E298E7